MRWNDQAVDGLKDEIDDCKHELDSLRELPASVARVATCVEKLEKTTDEIRQDAKDAERQEVRRIEALHRALERAVENVNKRFDQSDEDHRKVMKQLAARRNGAPKERMGWKEILAGVGAFTLPAATLVIYALEKGGG